MKRRVPFLVRKGNPFCVLQDGERNEGMKEDSAPHYDRRAERSSPLCYFSPERIS